MIVGTCILLAWRAHEGQVLDPGDVRGMRARQHAAGKALWIERQQLLGRNQLALQGLEFGVAAVAPVDLGWARVSCATSSTQAATSRFMRGEQ